MKTVLFNVPSNYFTQAIGAARLTGYLKKHGHDVKHRNCNYDFFYSVSLNLQLFAILL